MRKVFSPTPVPKRARRKRRSGAEIAAMTKEERKKDRQERQENASKKHRKKRKLQVEGMENEIKVMTNACEVITSVCGNQKQKIASLEGENKALRARLNYFKSLLWNGGQAVPPSTNTPVLPLTAPSAPSSAFPSNNFPSLPNNNKFNHNSSFTPIPTFSATFSASPQHTGVFFAMFAFVVMFAPWSPTGLDAFPQQGLQTSSGRVLLSTSQSSHFLPMLLAGSRIFLSTLLLMVLSCGVLMLARVSRASSRTTFPPLSSVVSCLTFICSAPSSISKKGADSTNHKPPI